MWNKSVWQIQEITHDQVSFRHLVWWLDHKWSGLLRFQWSLVFLAFLGFKVGLSSGSYMWSGNIWSRHRSLYNGIADQLPAINHGHLKFMHGMIYEYLLFHSLSISSIHCNLSILNSISELLSLFQRSFFWSQRGHGKVNCHSFWMSQRSRGQRIRKF